MDARAPELTAETLPGNALNATGWRADAANGVQRSLPEGECDDCRSPRRPLGASAAGLSRTGLPCLGRLNGPPATGRPISPAVRSLATRCLSVILLSNLMAILLQALPQGSASPPTAISRRPAAPAIRAPSIPALDHL